MSNKRVAVNKHMHRRARHTYTHTHTHVRRRKTKAKARTEIPSSRGENLRRSESGRNTSLVIDNVSVLSVETIEEDVFWGGGWEEVMQTGEMSGEVDRRTT